MEKQKKHKRNLETKNFTRMQTFTNKINLYLHRNELGNSAIRRGTSINKNTTFLVKSSQRMALVFGSKATWKCLYINIALIAMEINLER